MTFSDFPPPSLSPDLLNKNYVSNANCSCTHWCLKTINGTFGSVLCMFKLRFSSLFFLHSRLTCLFFFCYRETALDILMHCLLGHKCKHLMWVYASKVSWVPGLYFPLQCRAGHYLTSSPTVNTIWLFSFLVFVFASLLSVKFFLLPSLISLSIALPLPAPCVRWVVNIRCLCYSPPCFLRQGL